MKAKNFSIILLLFLVTFFCGKVSAQDNKGNDKTIKPALLVIDIQNEFLKYMSEDDKKFGMEIINGAIHMFRQSNLPIIRVYHTNIGWGPEPGTEPFQFPPTVIINENDPMIIKNYPSAFQKTDLEKILKDSGCNTIFLCGLSATGCVLATYFGGMERDFNTFMIKEAIISQNSDYTAMIRDICKTVDFQTMMFMLENMK
ncbi:MAG TPA: isochorismatase family cysteine hydrolase [Ignavibacteriaceae bacterium]|nr:isochorismatase family cysteine hydrolase [Ignavibacteriaceae bacterium]